MGRIALLQPLPRAQDDALGEYSKVGPELDHNWMPTALIQNCRLRRYSGGLENSGEAMTEFNLSGPWVIAVALVASALLRKVWAAAAHHDAGLMKPACRMRPCARMLMHLM